MSKWSTLLTKQKTYEITKLSPGMEYTVSINGTYNDPVEVWLTTLVEDENGIVEIEVNQNNAVYVGDLEYNKLTFTAQNLYTALVIRTIGDLELTTIQLEQGSTPTDWTPAPEDFNNLKGKSYALSQLLQKENILSLNGSFEEDDFVGLWLRNDKFVGFLDNQELTFDLGGRNLILDSENLRWSKSGGLNLEILPTYLDKKNVQKITPLEGGNLATIYSNPGEELSQPLVKGNKYILSFMFTYKGVKGTSNTIYLSGNTGSYQRTIGDIEEDKFNKHYVEIIPTSEPVENRIHMAFHGYEEVYVCDWKLEKGDVATDWTPAPEDLNSPESVVVKTLSEKGVINNAKLENGNTPTDWVPAWEDIPEEDKPVKVWDNMVVHMTPLDNGLTRIQTWGGKSAVKLTRGFTVPNKSTFSTNIEKVKGSTSFYHNSPTWKETNVKEGFSGELTFSTEGEKSRPTNIGIISYNEDKTVDITAGPPKLVDGDKPASWEADENPRIVNEGNTTSQPIIKIIKNKEEKLDVVINGTRLIYEFDNSKYIDIDCYTQEVTDDQGLSKARNLKIGYEFPELKPGDNVVQALSGDATILFRRKDAWK